jgi:lipopolysaccharide transport system permease protein
VAWFLAAIGVYLRDIDQVIVVFTTALLFVSAVFFPITALPERYQIFLRVNPLAILIEEGRKVLIFGQLPNFTVWSVLLVLGALTAWGGFAWFQKARKGFADVI